tara:strand:- start:2189 stop:2551 length:363 start_codon:yes stop_codon:yes gene_type:complete
MKINALKKVIKEVVREVIQEELKDILLEAVKSPKVISQPQQVVKENVQIPPQPTTSPIPTMSQKERFEKYSNILGQTGQEMFTSNQAQNFVPKAGADPVGGQLPGGNVSMEQIAGLMNSK